MSLTFILQPYTYMFRIPRPCTNSIITLVAGLVFMGVSFGLMFHAQTLLQIGLSVIAFLLGYIVFMWEVILLTRYSNE